LELREYGIQGREEQGEGQTDRRYENSAYRLGHISDRKNIDTAEISIEQAEEI